MPTGYTYNVGDGTLTEFRDFAVQCARAFGACITMRDDPADAQIPDEFPVDQYHLKHLREARAEMARLRAMTPDEIDNECRRINSEEHAAWERRKASVQAENARYEAMLAKVRAWTPPSEEHVKFKEFMVEQLATSMRKDVDQYGPTPLNGWQWHQRALEHAAREIQYHGQGHAEEVERTAGRNAWLQLLRESLS